MKTWIISTQTIMSKPSQRLEDLVLAIFLLPVYLFAVIWWWRRFHKWVWLSPVAYAQHAVSNWQICFISWVTWVLFGVALSFWSLV